MAGKTNQKRTFDVRLPDLAKVTSLQELGGLIEAIGSAVAMMAACPPEKLRITRIRMNSPLEMQFRSDQKTVAMVKARIGELAVASQTIMPGSARVGLAMELGRLAKKAGGSVELRCGSGRWRRLSHLHLKSLGLGRPKHEFLRQYRTSLTGTLEQVTVEGEKHRFRIREFSTGRNVQCDFPLNMLNDVKNALPHRVRVNGIVNCQAADEVDSVEAEDFTVLSEERDVPLTELQPLNITDGRDAAELIARLRDDE